MSLTVTETPAPIPLNITVAVYNEAGELVKHLFSGGAEASAQVFSADLGAFVSNNGQVTLTFKGQLQGGGSTLVWTGDNDSGQAVSGGTYYIKVESTDAFGTKSSNVTPVAVLPAPERQSLNIYNSAAEIVAHIDLSSLSSGSMAGFGFKDPSKSAYVAGASGGGVDFAFQDTQGNTVYYHWDGKNSQGAWLSSGSYVAQLVDEGKNGKVVVSHGFVMLADPGKSAFDVIAGPNPVMAADSVVVFAIQGLSAGQWASVKLYNSAGELISQQIDSAAGGRILLKVADWSAGIYLAVVEARQGEAVLSRKQLKLAISR